MLEAEGLSPNHKVRLVCLGQALSGGTGHRLSSEIDAGFVAGPAVSMGEEPGHFYI